MNTTNRFFSVRAVAAALTISALTAGVASSSALASDNDAPTAVVSYAGLDIASQAGARTLYQRIVFAAKQVCGAYDGRDIHYGMQRQACVANAVRGAVESTKQPAVMAVYAEKSGKQVTETLVALAR
jgi:UrcA family protein